MQITIDLPEFKYPIGYEITNFKSKLKFNIVNRRFDINFDNQFNMIHQYPLLYDIRLIVPKDYKFDYISQEDKDFLFDVIKNPHIDGAIIDYLSRYDITRITEYTIDEYLVKQDCVDMSLSIGDLCDNFNRKEECSPLYNEWVEYKHVCSEFKFLYEKLAFKMSDVSVTSVLKHFNMELEEFIEKGIDEKIDEGFKLNKYYFRDLYQDKLRLLKLQKRKEELYNILHANKTI